jgi:hypothetical protein
MLDIVHLKEQAEMPTNLFGFIPKVDRLESGP